MGAEPNLLCLTKAVSCNQDKEKENTMNGSEIILLLFVFRLIIPFGVLMLVGEWLRRKESNYWLK